MVRRELPQALRLPWTRVILARGTWGCRVVFTRLLSPLPGSSDAAAVWQAVPDSRQGITVSTMACLEICGWSRQFRLWTPGRFGIEHSQLCPLWFSLRLFPAKTEHGTHHRAEEKR
jgi:hypothetical protein